MDGARQRFSGKSKSKGSNESSTRMNLTEEEAVSQASSKWIKLFLIALLLCVFLPAILLILLPSPITPKEYPSVTPPATFDGPLALNDDLAFANKLYENQLAGPESLVIDGDNIYTGTTDGWIKHLHQGAVRKIVRLGQEPCGGYENENTCGRPLGLRMDKDGHLIVCDAYYGLFRVNVKTGEYTALYKASTPVNGKPSKMINDADVDSEGRVYFTDSSTSWNRNQFFNIIMEGDSSGRLLMYDPKTESTKQLIGNLMFPNGVQITSDGSAVLVTELSRARILRYDLKSKKFTVWADGLPGYPDNIRYESDSQTYWVAMSMPRFHDRFSMLDYLADKPWLRGTVAKVVTASNAHKMRSYMKLFGPPEPQALAIEFDNNGHIISSIQDRKGKVVQAISEVHFHNGIFYLGSYYDQFIAQLDYKKVMGQ